MIAEIIYRMENSPEFSGHSFSDVTAGKYYASAVEWANSVGIVKGYGDGTFGPEDEITREQFAAILYRYAGYKGYSTSAAADLSSFTDAAHISGYAKEAVSWANAENIIRGRGNGILDPKGGAKRSEAAQMLMNYGLKYTA